MKRLDELTEDDLNQIAALFGRYNNSPESEGRWPAMVGDVYDPKENFYWEKEDIDALDEMYTSMRYIVSAAYFAITTWQKRQESEGQGR